MIETPVIPEKISIISLKTIKGSIEANDNSGPMPVVGHFYNFAVATGVDIEQQVVQVTITVDIEACGENQNRLGINGSYTHEVVFSVDDLVDHFTKDGDNDFVISGAMGSTLLSIAFSTIRGIIFTRTQGTSLGTIILPVVNVATFVTNFKLPESQPAS
jgi:hypothetical protein